MREEEFEARENLMCGLLLVVIVLLMLVLTWAFKDF